MRPLQQKRVFKPSGRTLLSGLIKFLSNLATLLAGLLASALFSLGLTWLWHRILLRLDPGMGSASRRRKLAWQRAKLTGLSQAEAASRITDHFALELKELEKKRRKQTVRTAVFSIFNLTLVVLAFSQFWLDDFWGGMGTLGVLAFNIALIIVQQEFAQRQVKALLGQSGAASASVIREGRLQSVPLEDVVIGDLMAAGKGDEILAEGVLQGERSVELQAPGQAKTTCVVRPGELLLPGSVLLAGDALYEVRQLPTILHWKGESQFASVKKNTPLEHILQRILYGMLIFTGLFYALILLQIVQIDVLTPEQMTYYRDTLSIVFSLVPAGFFLMILVNYAMGSIDMARQGILVRDIRKVEALAEIDTLFILHTHSLLNLQVNLEMLPSSEAHDLDENLTRRILGSLAHSVTSRDVYLNVLAEEFSGEVHPLKEEAFFFSLLGWGGAVVDQPGVRGTYVLGYPKELKPYLLRAKDGRRRTENERRETGNGERGTGDVESRFSRLKGKISGLFGRGKRKEMPQEKAEEIASMSATSHKDKEATSHNDSFKERLKSSLQSMGNRIETIQGIPQAIEGSQTELLDLILAYLPDPVALFQPDGSLDCPYDLIPVCRLSFRQQTTPAVKAIIERLRVDGVRLKLMSALPNDQAAAYLTSLKIIEQDPPPDSLLSALELEITGDQQVTSAQVISDASPQAMTRVIQAYRRSRMRVSALGNDYATWEALRLADVSIANKDSDQALTARADIVLLKKSLAPLNPLLERGQQIVHGTLDVMRLNLVQLFYLLMILLATFLLGSKVIPFNASQGGMIAFFTVAIPAAVMSFWSPKGRVNHDRMTPELMRFVLPASLWIAPVALALFYLYAPASPDVIYPRHVVTHALVCMGTLVALFARPPIRWLAGGAPVAVDRRPALTVGLSFLVWNLLVFIPLAQKYLLIAPLESLQDYGVVWLVSLAVGGMIQLTWRILR